MLFRASTESDIDRIMEIIEEGRAALAALGVDQWQGGYPNRDAVAGDVARGESFVVEDEGQVLATAMISLGGEAIYDRLTGGAWLTASTSDAPRYAVVHRVAVSNACTGRGVGGFLMASAEGHARACGCESVRVDTHERNAPMRRLLERAGYARCGIVLIDHAEGATPERTAYEKTLA